MSEFTAYVDEWVRETEARMLAVFKRAVELLADELRFGRHNGGRVPWDTGNMVRSLVSVLNGSVQTGEGPFNAPGDVEAKISMMTMGDVISLGYQAIYARHVNYGTVNMQGAHFVEYAALMWPTMVQLAAEEIRALASA